MPNLPTVNLSQVHFDRVVAAFPGNTLAEKAEAYQAWLVNHIIDFVEQVEAQAIDRASNIDKINKLQKLRESLPPKVPFPPGPPPENLPT